MRVTCAPDGEIPGALHVSVSGNLDTVGSEKFLAEIAPHVVTSCPSLLFDLSGVDWVSSGGVGALVRLLTRAQRDQSGFAVFGCSSRVRSVLHICGLEGALNVRDTAGEARECLRRGGSG